MPKESSSKKIVAIVLARGGSKGIPGKNIIPFCGKPLLAWTIEQLQRTPEVDHVFVSSDSPLILTIARQMGCGEIERPEELSGDTATSESGWLHALNEIERRVGTVDLIVAAQATSPLRSDSDVSNAIQAMQENDGDSLFSASPSHDLCLWKVLPDREMRCLSYDPANPNRRRQDREGLWVENGSFYLFRPDVLRQTGTRFGRNCGIYPMRYWQMFEIDEPGDVELCEVLMSAFLEGKLT